jgi:hypothetical protein
MQQRKSNTPKKIDLRLTIKYCYTEGKADHALGHVEVLRVIAAEGDGLNLQAARRLFEIMHNDGRELIMSRV